MNRYKRLTDNEWKIIAGDNSNKDTSGFFDLPTYKFCRHPQHKPPGHMVIPQGKGYRHICLSCGNVTILIPQQFSLQHEKEKTN